MPRIGRMARGKLGGGRRLGDRRQKMKKGMNIEKSFKFTVSREDNEEAASSSSVSFRISNLEFKIYDFLPNPAGRSSR